MPGDDGRDAPTRGWRRRGRLTGQGITAVVQDGGSAVYGRNFPPFPGGRPGPPARRSTPPRPGGPAGRAGRVFERFVRLEAGPGRNGLGLPIARAVARAHGGDLTCEDAEAGARFVFRIPAREGAVGRPPVAGTERVPAGNIGR